MTRKKKLAVAALAIAGVTAVACAAHRHARGPHGERAYKFVSHRVEHVLDDVEATDDQKKRVHEVKDRVFADFQQFHANAKTIRGEALREWKKDAPDAKKLHGRVDERIDDLRTAMHGLVDGMIEVHGTLDQEQRAEITEMVEDHMELHEH